MDSLFLWELGTPKVYLIWLLVLAAQIAVAEINRRWNWTIFAVWTVGGIALMPYAWIHGTPMVGWFPFGKYAIMILTATMTGTVLVYAKRNPVKAHKYAIWLGVALWIGLAVNIMEANIRDLTIYFNADSYYACGADWQCLKGVNDAHTIDMIAGLPEARGVSAELHSQQWVPGGRRQPGRPPRRHRPGDGLPHDRRVLEPPVRRGRPAQHHHDHGPGQDHRDLAR